MTSPKNPVQPAPHSWSVPDWPGFIYPGNGSKGRYLIQTHRAELVRAGAIVRIGRDLVVMGAPYTRWLATKGHLVLGYEAPPNRV